MSRESRQLAREHQTSVGDLEDPEIELSVVIPCLNEAETLPICIEKAQRAIAQAGLCAEVIVADNGSSDSSREIAHERSARVVDVERAGYGSALMGGIEASRGRFVIMGDADDSYDFGEIPRFIEELRAGNQLVMGCRLPSGGGTVLPGAMPALHRWLGNPLFSLLARRWFQAPIHDVYCGLRGFSRELYDRLDLRCTGMEFATEMVIKASLERTAISEVAITLHPDGRTSHAPHLKTYADGWRTLRLFLLYSPRWLFLLPGFAFLLLGLLGYGLALPGTTIGRATLGAHTLLFASLAMLCGYQSILFALLTKTFAITEGLLPQDRRLARLYRSFDLEKGLLLSLALMLAGVAALLVAVNTWRLVEFGPLDYAHTMRWVIPGATLTVLGFQTLLSSFFISILGMSRR